MIRRSIIFAAAVIALASTQVSAQSPTAENTVNRGHSFVKHAEQIYQQYLDSERRGDAESYRRIRTKEAYDATVENLKRTGKPAADLGPMLKTVAAWQTDVTQFAFIRCDAKGAAARLLYRREGQEGKEPTLEFAVVMVQWEGGTWRIGPVGNSRGPKSFMGKERTVDELLDGPRFVLK